MGTWNKTNIRNGGVAAIIALVISSGIQAGTDQGTPEATVDAGMEPSADPGAMVTTLPPALPVGEMPRLEKIDTGTSANIVAPGPKPDVAIGELNNEVALADPEALARERTINKEIAEDLKSNYGSGVKRLIARDGSTEISLRQAALAGLQQNLAIQRSQLADKMAAAALVEAKAVFDPVLNFSMLYSVNQKNDRIEKDYEQKVTAVEVGLGEVGPRGDVPCKKAVCYRVYFLDESSLVTYVEFDRQRIPGQMYLKESIYASESYMEGKQKKVTSNVALQQSFWWGANLSFTLSIINQDRVYTLYPDARRAGGYCVNSKNYSTFDTCVTLMGNLNRPWSSSLTLGFNTTLPWTKGFGKYSPQNTSVLLSEIGKERSRWTVESTINSTLQTIEMAYWDLVDATTALYATLENKKNVQVLVKKTNRLFKVHEITQYNKDEMDAELARVEGLEESRWNGLVQSSNKLKKLLEIDDRPVLLPTGYSSILYGSRREQLARMEATTDNNPDIQVTKTGIKSADVNVKAGETGVRPDILLSLSESVSQTSSRTGVGFKSLNTSLEDLDSPDTLSQSANVSFTRPWGNRAAKATLAQARIGKVQSAFQLESIRGGIELEYKNAVISLESAAKRVAITASNLDLAQMAFDKAEVQREQRSVTEYELVVKSGDVLTARLDWIRALIDRKKSEAKLFGATGAIASQYPNMIAVNSMDRNRLQRMASAKVLNYFGNSR